MTILLLQSRTLGHCSNAGGSTAFSFQEKAAQSEHIHLCPQKAIERFLGITDDRLVFIKGGVEHHRYAGQLAENFNQAVITRIRFFVHGL